VAGTHQLAIDWAPAKDNVGVTGYEVSRNGAVIGTTARTQWLDQDLPDDTNYTYTVRAVDAAANRSSPSGNLGAKTVKQSNATTGTLAGAVYDGTGAALENVVVKIALPNGTVKSLKTNADGVWKLANLVPAQYSIAFSLGGRPSQTVTAAAVAGQTVLTATLVG
jgi:chitin-binding protein